MSDIRSIPEVGTTVRGRVVRFLPNGALLETREGFKGLLHGSQVSWLNKRAKVNEVLKIGDELDLVVLEVKHSKKSETIFISFGHLQTQQNPWENVEEKHAAGHRVKAKIVDLLPYGVTVEFESGFRALVHNSEVSWTERKPKAHDFLRLGDEIEVVILLIDKEKRRISASYRQAIENPWVRFLQKYPIGTKTRGRVVLVRDFGVFVMLPNGCIGLMHKNNFPSGESSISLGDALGVVILAYDPEKQHISLGHCDTDFKSY